MGILIANAVSACHVGLVVLVPSLVELLLQEVPVSLEAQRIGRRDANTNVSKGHVW